MFNKTVCALCWIAWTAIFISLLTISKENKMLRAELNKPINCEAVCAAEQKE